MIDLRDNIESLREELCLLILDKKLTNIEVVLCSQHLDKLLIQYEKEINLKRIKNTTRP